MQGDTADVINRCVGELYRYRLAVLKQGARVAPERDQPARVANLGRRTRFEVEIGGLTSHDVGQPRMELAQKRCVLRSSSLSVVATGHVPNLLGSGDRVPSTGQPLEYRPGGSVA